MARSCLGLTATGRCPKATSVELRKVIIDPTHCFSRLSTEGHLAIEDFADSHAVRQTPIENSHALPPESGRAVRKNAGPCKNVLVKLNHLYMHQLGLSNLSYLSRIVAQPPQSSV